MAAEISGITESNQDSHDEYSNDHLDDLLHRILFLLLKHDALLEQFRPLIESYRTPAAAWAVRRAGRRAVPQDSNGQVQDS